MEKFNFGTYDPTKTLVYDASKGYTEPSSETDTRRELSCPLREIQEFLDDVTPVNDNDKAIQLVVDDRDVINYRTTPDGTLHEIYATGPAGPAGQGVPTGGTAGQVLMKDSSDDYDTSWADSIIYGDETGTFDVPLNADTLNGYSAIDLLKYLYPVGAIYQNTTNTDPSTIITGTTWALRSSVALASENVFGNGKVLGFTDSSGYSALAGRGSDYSQVSWTRDGIGNDVGTTSNYLDSFASGYKTVGVPTKAQLGANPQNSGLIADTITIYTWERTA